MPEIVADGQPFQSSPEVASQRYASTPPAFSNYFSALFEDSSPVAALQRASERGTQQGASGFDRFITTTGQAQEGIVTPGQDSNVQPPQQSPTLDADEANKRYAPTGTTITAKPITEGLAQIIGKQKQAEMDREDVISRAAAAHSWPTNFLAGMAAFTLDPLNAATMFIPGIGEEAVTAALGRGVLAKVTGRAVAGATGAVAGQAPLVGLHLGLSDEEAGDYQARDALRDLFYSAAGGAVLQPIFGALGDRFAPRPIERRVPPSIESPTAPEIKTTPPSPEVHATAMRAGISQILEGRPVDVLPVIDADGILAMSREAQLRNESDNLAGQLSALPVRAEEAVASEKLARLSTVERNLKDENLSVADRAALMRRRDELLTDTTPEALRATAAPIEQRRALGNQKDAIDRQIEEVAAQRAQSLAARTLAPSEPGLEILNLKSTQEQLYRNGFAHGIPQSELNAVNEQVYGIRPPAETGPRSALTIQDEHQAAVQTAETQGGQDAAAKAKPEAIKPITPEEEDAAALEQQWKTMTANTPIKIDAEQLAELRAASAEFDKAVSATEGHTQAAACINGAGI